MAGPSAVGSGGNPEAVEADVTSIRVWRGKDFHVFHAPMDARESAAMSRLLAGASFAELCQVFEDLEEQQAAQEAGALLVRWLEDGSSLASSSELPPHSQPKRRNNF